MKKLLFTVLSFLITATVVFSQTKTNSIELNFGFEKTTPNQELPDNWFQWGSGYKLSIDSTVKHNGRNSLLIQPSDGRSSNSFGCVAFKIPTIYEGDEIELKAYMKLNNVKEGTIGLMLRIDGYSGILKFDNMMQKNIQGTSDWTLYSVKLPLSNKAKTIYVGAILDGTGQLWVDDFELLIDGNDILKAKQKVLKEYKADKDNEFDKESKIVAFKPTENNINDLKVLGMVWGFLKYYHPNIAAGNYNWDYELFRILPKIIDAKNSIERDNILTTWIKNLGNFDVAQKSDKEVREVKITPDLDWINQSNLAADLVSELTKIKNAKRGDENYYISLENGVGNPEFNTERPYSEMKYPDTGFRLLSLYRYWNVIQYYFPYKHLIEVDWKGVLKEFIPKFINADSEIGYKLAALELIARIHDTHANIWGQDEALKKYWGVNRSPIIVTFIENKAVVTDYYDKRLGEKDGLKVGDVITKINNKSVDEIVLEKLKYSPASNYPTQLRDIARTLLASNDTSMNIEYNRSGISEIKWIKTYSSDKLNVYKKYESHDTCFKFINPNIGYIYPGSIKNEYLPKIMKEIQNTKGIIIDIRCYPSDFIVFSLGKYLMPDSTAFVKFTKGSVTSPGLFTMTQTLKVGENNSEYYKGKVVILINETTQSNAEYTTMALRVAPKVTVIGSTTAGADGNVSHLYLPGGISTMISGIGVYYPNGRETQRIGIVPDIELKPTIDGIRKGKDELLDKAIEIINAK